MNQAATLTPNRIYNSFSLVFYITAPDHDFPTRLVRLAGTFSAEHMAGMFIASNLMGMKLYTTNYIRAMKQIYSSDNTTWQVVHMGGDYHDDKILSTYNVKYADEINNGEKLPVGKYGLWIIGNLTKYNLVMFDSPEFLQGFITICNAFQVDYHDYIAGNVFQYDESGNKIEYRMEL